MAAAYITESDIKNRNMNKFPTLEIASYVDDANQWFEEYIPTIIDDDTYGVDDVDLPVKTDVKNFILNYMYMQFAVDAINEGSTTVSANNLYESMYSIAKDVFAGIKPRITQSIMLKTNTDRSSSSVNWGTMVR
jgi:predicted choloylglycine hydrolase